MCPNPFCCNKRNNHNYNYNSYWKNSQTATRFFYFVALIKTYLFSLIIVINENTHITCNNARTMHILFALTKKVAPPVFHRRMAGINRVAKLNHGELDAERIEDDTRASRSRFIRIWAITAHFHGALPFWASFAIILNRISRIHDHVAERERKYHSRRIGFSWSHRPIPAYFPFYSRHAPFPAISLDHTLPSPLPLDQPW